jgi:hypothetical protein
MTTMEDLFAPTTRFRDLYHAAREGIDDEDDSDYDEEEAMEALVELELVTGSSAEDTFLHSGFSLAWSRKSRVAKPRRLFQLDLD